MKLYMPFFRNCTSPKCLSQLHAHLLVTGHLADPVATTKLIETYAKMGSIESAKWVFSTSTLYDSFMWGVAIKSFVWNHLFKEAISLYHEIHSHQLQLTCYIFPSVLKACSALHDMRSGRKIHGRIIKSGFESDGVVETALLNMYGNGDSLEDARQVFDKMLERDLVSWSSIISTYVRNGWAHEGVELYIKMELEQIVPDSVLMVSLAQACGDLGSLQLSKMFHGYIVRREIKVDAALENSLVIMYGKSGDYHTAEKLLEKASQKDVIFWTAIISGYNQSANYRGAFDIFVRMLKSEVDPNEVTMARILQSCACLEYLKEGKSLHAYVIRRVMGFNLDLIGLALIDMYANCGKIGDCGRVFEIIQEEKVILWNSLISAYTRNGFSKEALTVFSQMHAKRLLPDSFTLASSLSACGQSYFLLLGSQIHGYIAKSGFLSNTFVQNSLINMYCKCGLLDIAYEIFHKVEKKDIITWNSLMSGFAQNGNSMEAIALIDQMYSEGLLMDTSTFVNAIQACSQLSFLEKGRWVHHKFISYGLEKDIFVDTALVDMYAKCGDLGMARRLFDNMNDKSVVSWSAMIAGYGIHGQVKIAIALFSQMIALGVKPNGVTFLSILSACCHVGYVDEGQFYFDLMRREFHIQPKLDHFTCMVDLLSRAGHIEGAYNFIKSMNLTPNACVWRALLNGCRIYRRMDMIDKIHAENLNMKSSNLENYVLISNIFAEGGKWEEFGKVRLMMKDYGLRKATGYSTIEVNKRIYKFCAGDTSHPHIKKIYTFLEDLERLAWESCTCFRESLEENV